MSSEAWEMFSEILKERVEWGKGLVVFIGMNNSDDSGYALGKMDLFKNKTMR